MVLQREKEAASTDEDAAANSDNKKYIYFQVSRDKDSYSISAYRTKVPVPINDNATLLEKNGPVCLADYIGSITGEKITDKPWSPGTVFDYPKESEEIDLISGVKAHKGDEGCTVWWQQGSWTFEYAGASYGIDAHLRSLAEDWKTTPTALTALKGDIRMFEGNHFGAYIMWEQNGVRYTYTLADNDNWNEIINVLSNFTQNAKITP